MRRFLKIVPLSVLLFLASCTEPNTPTTPVVPPSGKDSTVVTEPDTVVPMPLSAYLPSIEEMTLREKVGQLFNIRLESLNGGATVINGNGGLTRNFAQYPAGGFTLFGKNISNPTQLDNLTYYIHSLSSYPLVCVDEEGGTVARVANNAYFSVTKYSNMYSIGQTGDPEQAYQAGSTIGGYLSEYGIDVDLAPVADVWTNPDNTVIGKRAFSSDPAVVAQMTERFAEGLQANHVVGCYKHFPGHGDTSTDTHYGYASTSKTWDEMLSCEIIPFAQGIASGIEMIMCAHIAAPAVTKSNDPATVSHLLITDKLRSELGFDGIIITDGMEMGAITSQYAAGEAAVKALKAGCDIILCPADYYVAFDAVVEAVEAGTINEERINESVARVLALKRKVLIDKGLVVAD